MVKEKRILSYFLGWLIVGFCIIFVGVNNVFAAEYYINYDTYQRYYDNTGILTEVDITWNESLQSYISGNLTTVSGSTGAAWLVASPIPMVKGHQYSISFAFVERNNIALSSKNKISISNTVNGAVSSYNNSTYNAETIYSKVTSNTTLSFVFKANTNSSFIVIPFTTTSRVTQNYSVTMFVMEDLGSSGLSQEELNTTINNQTNIINNSIDNTKNEIINNQNQNNEELKDTIKDQFNTCGEKEIVKEFTNNDIDINGYYLDISGNQVQHQYYGIISDFEIKQNTNYTIRKNVVDNSPSYCLYDGNKNLIDCVSYSGNTELTFNSGNAKYISLSINNGNTSYIKLIFLEEVCSNKIDETNDKLDNIEGALTDSSAPNTSGLENSAGWLPPGPLDSILNLPLTMLNSLTNSLGNTCSPLNLTLPYINKNIQIPCLSAIFAQITGVNGLWSWVGTIASVLILYNYLLNLYAWVDRVLTLRAEFDEAMGADLANWGRL